MTEDEESEFEEAYWDVPKASLQSILTTAVNMHKAGHMMTKYHVEAVVSTSLFIVVATTSIGTTRRFRVKIQEMRQ